MSSPVDSWIVISFYSPSLINLRIASVVFHLLHDFEWALELTRNILLIQSPRCNFDETLEL